VLEEHVQVGYAADPAKRAALLALLHQEFQERILLVTDLFVEAREDELREQEDSYRQATDNAPAAIFQVDHDGGRIFGASKVAEKILGYRRDQIVGMRIWDLIPSDERSRAIRLFEETRRRGYSNREDLHLHTRGGELVPVFFNAGLIEYGQHRFFQIICVDISDRKRLESQLIQSEKMAAIGQLAAGIAHEIRNPLGIITNALYDLGELVDTGTPEVAEDLRIAKEEMGRVQAIINNLLEFSRESRAELEVVDINDLLRKTLQLLHKGLQNSGVRVVTNFAPLGTCMANQNALRQIFLNLITNAVQAMPRGGELRLRTAPLLDGRIQLEFSDTGVGIPPEDLKDIFNPFFTTKAPGQGTGLGLSVVHSVVKRYQGEIRVESQPNRGTTFTIEFPCPCASEIPAAEALLTH
jgi:PAS domain S-box-containing protein